MEITASQRDSGLDRLLNLALGLARHPRTGMASALAALGTNEGVCLSAVYLVPPQGPVELAASGGPLARELGALRSLDDEESERFRTMAQDVQTRWGPAPPDVDAAWPGCAVVGRVAGALPRGWAFVLLLGEPSGSRPPLERITAVVSLLAAALVAERELDRLGQELHRARQDRALLAASLRHDLRGPLTAIRGSAMTLDEHFDAVSHEERRELLGMIARQAERLADMLTEGLSGSAADPDEPVLLRPADLQDVVRRAVSAARLARDGRIEIEVPPAVRVVTDASRIERCLLNLIDNALKYSPPTEVVHVSGERDTEGFIVTVADAGQGVSPEILPTLFRPFATDPNREGGVGLGLYSASCLIGELGGRLTHARHGGWTRFSLLVPDPVAGAPRERTDARVAS